MSLDELAQKPTVDVVTAARVLIPDCSRSAAYAMAARGEIPTLRLGRQLRVPVPRLLALLGVEQESDMTNAGPPTPGAAITDSAGTSCDVFAQQ